MIDAQSDTPLHGFTGLPGDLDNTSPAFAMIKRHGECLQEESRHLRATLLGMNRRYDQRIDELSGHKPCNIHLKS